EIDHRVANVGMILEQALGRNVLVGGAGGGGDDEQARPGDVVLPQLEHGVVERRLRMGIDDVGYEKKDGEQNGKANISRHVDLPASCRRARAVRILQSTDWRSAAGQIDVDSISREGAV